MELKKIEYADLNSRQQENYNFQKFSAVLADYGFVCLRLSDDWLGADFIASHADGRHFLKVQLKGRLTIDKKYQGQDIYIAFRDGGEHYLVPHDALSDYLIEHGTNAQKENWSNGTGAYSWPGIPKRHSRFMDTYKL